MVRMLLIPVLGLSLISTALAHQQHGSKPKSQHHHKYPPKFTPSLFDVSPLNSPVKGSMANFLLKAPAGFEIDRVKYRIKNAGKLREKDMTDQEIKLVNGPQGKELHIPVSKLPPGFYQLHVVVIDKKQKKEHWFKSAYHDHVRFVIDESMQVPMPDPKKNDASIGGIDSDNDGIRDDVQRWINETYAAKPNLKLAMKQYAVAYQNVLTTVEDKSLNIQAIFKTFEAGDCIQGLVGLDSKIEERERSFIKFLNTKDRLMAEKKADLNFHGQGRELSDNLLSFCSFTIE